MTYVWHIYKIINPKGRVYIGVTRNLKLRIRSYKYSKCRSQIFLGRSIEKYGFENHIFEIIDCFESTHEYAMGKEMFWVRGYMSNHRKYPFLNGMNMTDGGDGTLGHTVSKKTRMALSEAGKRKENVHRLKTMNIGRSPHNKGKKSELSESCRKEFYGARNLGNKYNLGRKRPLTEDQKIKRMKAILCYDSNNSLVGEYRSIKDAAKEVGLFTAQIGSSLRGKYKNRKGLVFKYKK